MKKLRFGKTQDEPTCGESHDEFVELCALSTCGALTESEQRRLESHLTSCHDCRKAMREFNAVVVELHFTTGMDLVCYQGCPVN